MDADTPAGTPGDPEPRVRPRGAARTRGHPPGGSSPPAKVPRRRDATRAPGPEPSGPSRPAKVQRRGDATPAPGPEPSGSSPPATLPRRGDATWTAHPTACVDPGAEIGAGTRIWHWTHVSSGARIGRRCVLGQNVFVADGTTIGDGVKIQNNVSVYEGVHLDDDVFCGPSAVFTNVATPRAHVNRRGEFLPTHVGRGATIGANATVICGRRVGRYAFVGAGAVVSRDVPDHALVTGVPARVTGWVCRCGVRLPLRPGDSPRGVTCGRCGDAYAFDGERVDGGS